MKLVRKGADLEARNNEGATALMFYCGHNSELIKKALIEAGANVNVRDDEGMTPLINAAAYGELEAVRALIQANSDVNVYTAEQRKTPLMFAISSRWRECVHPAEIRRYGCNN